mgnify:CR=1 FL=1
MHVYVDQLYFCKRGYTNVRNSLIIECTKHIQFIFKWRFEYDYNIRLWQNIYLV